MPYINIRGVEHYYEWLTSADRALNNDQANYQPGHKPIFVFIHGWAGSTRYWHSTAQAFTDRFDCLLYDLRGFGRSRLSRPIVAEVEAIGYEIASYADDLALLLDQLGVKQPVYLNAHSTGGSIAVRFMNLYPGRVERAVLTCNGVFEYDERAFKAFHQFGGYVVAFRPDWLLQIPGVDRLFMQRFLRRPIAAAARRAFLEDFIRADYEAALGTVLTAVCEKAAIEMPEEFAKLTVPTLLVSGQFDKIIPAELGRKAAALNPLVEQVIMPNTAHFPMLEDPVAYLQRVEQFLAVGDREEVRNS